LVVADFPISHRANFLGAIDTKVWPDALTGPCSVLILPLGTQSLLMALTHESPSDEPSLMVTGAPSRTLNEIRARQKTPITPGPSVLDDAIRFVRADFALPDVIWTMLKVACGSEPSLIADTKLGFRTIDTDALVIADLSGLLRAPF